MSEKRFFLFILLSTAIIFFTPMVVNWIWPTPPAPPPQQEVAKKAEPEDQPAAKEAGQEKEPAEAQVKADPEDEPRRQDIPVQPPVILGSDDPNSDYFLQVRLRNVGASVDEVILNRFENEERTGPLALLSNSEPAGPWRTVTGVPFGSFALDMPQLRADLARRTWHVDGPSEVKDGEGREGVRVRFYRPVEGTSLEVAKTFTVWKGSYAIDVSIQVRNVGSDDVEASYWLYGPRGTVLEGWWYSWTKRNVALSVLRQGDLKRGTHYAADLADAAEEAAEQLAEIDADRNGLITRDEWTRGTTEPWPDEFDLDGDDRLSRSEALLYSHVIAGRDQRWDLLEETEFAGTETQYFCALMLPVEETARQVLEIWPIVNSLYLTHPDLSDVSVLLKSKTFVVPPGEAVEHRYRVYVGPRDEETFIAATGRADLAGHVSNYGMFSGIARIMLAILKFFHRIIPNWGVAIILLTVVVRLAMHPLTRRQVIMSQRMQKKMAAIKPELDKLREKYKDDREALGRATLELYRKHGINPLAPLQGCLPLLLQMPIFIGLWRALSSAVELRQAPFVLWIDNLAAPDMLFPFGVNLPILGPYFNLLPVLSLVLMYYQQKWLTPPSPDPEVQAQQRMTMIMMTIFTLLIFYKLPSGLCLYFLASTAWGLAERKLIPKVEHLDEEEPEKPEPKAGKRKGRRPPKETKPTLVEKFKQTTVGRKLIEIIEQAEKK